MDPLKIFLSQELAAAYAALKKAEDQIDNLRDDIAELENRLSREQLRSALRERALEHAIQEEDLLRSYLVTSEQMVRTREHMISLLTRELQSLNGTLLCREELEYTP